MFYNDTRKQMKLLANKIMSGNRIFFDAFPRPKRTCFCVKAPKKKQRCSLPELKGLVVVTLEEIQYVFV